MGRRRQNQPIVVVVAASMIGLIGLCCGGPMALLTKSKAPKPTVTPKHVPQALAVIPSPFVEHRPEPVVIPAMQPIVAPVQPRAAEPKSFPAAKREVKEEPTTRPEVFRTWSNDTGKHQVTAALASFDESKALLQREDGKPLPLALNKLSEADRTYVKGLTNPPTFLENGKIIFGETVGVTDGDTITVLDDEKTKFKIRLEGIDAPESHQAYGTQSKKTLSDKVFGKHVRVEWKEKDKYGRTLGHVYFGTRYINLEMLEEGEAWHYKKYNSDEELAAAEVRAKDERVGLWKDLNPIAPWEFRKGLADEPVVAAPVATAPAPRSKRALVATPQVPETTETTVYITNTGTKYHRSGCRHLSKSKIPVSLSAARSSHSPCSVCNPP